MKQQFNSKFDSHNWPHISQHSDYSANDDQEENDKKLMAEGVEKPSVAHCVLHLVPMMIVTSKNKRRLTHGTGNIIMFSFLFSPSLCHSV